MTDPLRARLAAFVATWEMSTDVLDALAGHCAKTHLDHAAVFACPYCRRLLEVLKAALLREPPEAAPPSHTAPKLAPRERARRALMGIFINDDLETRVADAIVAAEDEAYKAATEDATHAARATVPEPSR
jgi:hypothetical protein